MWPWEHLAFGYILYSVYLRARFERPSSYLLALSMGLATQLPDLIDKPLAWTFDILPTGRSLGHSIFFALVVTALASQIGRRNGLKALGPAVGIGYGSHLLGDVIYHVVTRILGNEPLSADGVNFLFWPFIDQPVRESAGMIFRTDRLFREFLGFLGTPTGTLYLALELGLIVGASLLLILDLRAKGTLTHQE